MKIENLQEIFRLSSITVVPIFGSDVYYTDHPCSGPYYAVLLSILLSVSPSIWVKEKVAQAQLIFELAISYCRREVWFAKMLQCEFLSYAQHE